MGKRMAALALAVCMALPLFGCGGKLKAQSLTEGITARTIDTHTDLTGDSTAVMDFAAALLRQTAESEGVLLSPVSVLYALGMTANGASGDTLTQLEQAMGMDLTSLNDYLYTYRMSLPENTKSVSCRCPTPCGCGTSSAWTMLFWIPVPTTTARRPTAPPLTTLW